MGYKIGLGVRVHRGEEERVTLVVAVVTAEPPTCWSRYARFFTLLE